MNYDQAMEYKRNLDPELLAQETYDTTVVVVPAEGQDFYQYIQNLPDRKPVDSDAKYYSSKGEYRVVLLKFQPLPAEYRDL